MNKVINALGRILNACSVISGYITFALGLFVAVEVLFRLFGSPIKGESELITHSMIFIVYFALGYTSYKDLHIKMDIIKDSFVLDRLWAVIELAVMLIMAYASYKAMLSAFHKGLASSLLGLIRYPFVGLTGVGFLMMFVGTLSCEVRNYYQHHLEKRTGKPALEGGEGK